MQRGRKPPNPSTKKLSGTFRADRHANVVELSVVPVADITPPDWLSDGAKAVWATELRRLIATGATEADTSMLALYCETLSTFIAGVKAGQPVNAAFRSELRKQMELLGIGGTKSRLSRITAPEQKAASPFAPRKR